MHEDENPVYGTTHVILALRELLEAGEPSARPLLDRANHWLASAQNSDGGWGGAAGAPSTTEETSLAVEALAGTEYVASTDRGVEWMVRKVEDGSWANVAPIGFYFAKLWYYEALYPKIWAVAALGRVSSLSGLGGQPTA